MTDNGLAALAEAIHVGRNHQHDPRAGERPHAHLISKREQEEAAAILANGAVFLPDGLTSTSTQLDAIAARYEAEIAASNARIAVLTGQIADPKVATIAARRVALDGLVEAAERVLAYGRVRPFADAARDQLRAALTAAKETP